jgi:UDPglucose 6-dehydrogenase
VAFDPVAMHRAALLLPDGTVSYATDPYAACTDADAVLFLTEWPEFTKLDWARVKQLLKLPIVLDGKNMLNPGDVRQKGLRYYGVGSAPDPLDQAMKMLTERRRENEELEPALLILEECDVTVLHS